MLKGFGNRLLDFTKKVLTGSSPYDVLEIPSAQLSRYVMIRKEKMLVLYKDRDNFVAVLDPPTMAGTAFSVFRVASETEAVQLFDCLNFKLEALSRKMDIWKKEQIQQIFDVVRMHPLWGCAHIAAKLGLIGCFADDAVILSINDVEEDTGIVPIFISIETENVDLIKEMLYRNVRLDLSDKHGRNVFHYAAKTKNEMIIQFLASKNCSAVNSLDAFGESALHEACLSGQAKNVEQLLRWNADPLLTQSDRYPVHCAVLTNSLKCLSVLCHWSRDQVHLQDKIMGGTPLHWAKSRECIYALCDFGCNIEAVNKQNETGLMVMVKNSLFDCAMGLLAKGANADIRDGNGNSPLHKAVEICDPGLVQMLIVFGSNVNASNNENFSARHLAAVSSLKDKDYILFLLNGVGAKRCGPDQSGCSLGCVTGGCYNGRPKSTPVSSPENQKRVFDSVLSDVAMAAAMTRSASASESAVLRGSDSVASSPGISGDRVLCLDGGGIRGLVLIQMLLVIEQTIQQPIRNCFDWIGGTSTGGILSLAIVHGKTVRYCQGLYFQLKDAVFNGKRPYDSAPLEEFLKKEFGETTRMTEHEYPRVIVTGVLADRMPAEMHLFRNYDIPGQHQEARSKTDSFLPLPKPNDQLVWRAARSTGAAPTYFRASGRFLDGGLMANNPTLDILTEIHQYNLAKKTLNNSELSRPIHVVVSLGTGRLSQRSINTCDVFRPEGLLDFAQVAFGAKNLSELLIDQATQSEGRVVERAEAWCSMIGVPYYRFSPQLSEDISLDCKDDKTLVNMLWETQAYIFSHHDKLMQLATLLWP